MCHTKSRVWPSAKNINKEPIIERWVVGSILHGGPIELFHVPVCAPSQRPWYVLSCLWDDAYEGTLSANQKE